MDRLPPRPPRIEIALATRHFHKGALVLYAITSSYFEGNSYPLALLGVSRDLPGLLLVGDIKAAIAHPVSVPATPRNAAAFHQ